MGPMVFNFSNVDWSYLFSPYALRVVSGENSSEPLTGAKAVYGGSSDHTCVLLRDGKVRCWAWNGGTDGQLGINDTETTYSTAPVGFVLGEDLKPLAGVKEIAIGGDFTCALLSDSTVKCWGWNAMGSLGTGDTDNRPVATSVKLRRGGVLSGVKAIYSERGGHVCALTSDKLYCWGNNERGEIGSPQLGIGGKALHPVEIPWFEAKDITSVAVGGGGRDPSSTAVVQYHGDHTCVVIRESEVYCWGSNTRGQLGSLKPQTTYKPLKVDFSKISFK